MKQFKIVKIFFYIHLGNALVYNFFWAVTMYSTAQELKSDTIHWENMHRLLRVS